MNYTFPENWERNNIVPTVSRTVDSVRKIK